MVETQKIECCRKEKPRQVLCNVIVLVSSRYRPEVLLEGTAHVARTIPTSCRHVDARQGVLTLYKKESLAIK